MLPASARPKRTLLLVWSRLVGWASLAHTVSFRSSADTSQQAHWNSASSWVGVVHNSDLGGCRSFRVDRARQIRALARCAFLLVAVIPRIVRATSVRSLLSCLLEGLFVVHLCCAGWPCRLAFVRGFMKVLVFVGGSLDAGPFLS